MEEIPDRGFKSHLVLKSDGERRSYFVIDCKSILGVQFLSKILLAMFL